MPSRRELAAALRFMAPLEHDPPEKRSPGAGSTGAMSFRGDTVDPTPEGDAAQGASDRERDDDYRDVVVRLSDKWRVIHCRDGLQFVIQRSDGERCGRARWTGRHYCVTREALIRLCHASCERLGPADMAILLALPERCGVPA